MIFKINWQPNSVITFNEELDFIIKKWNFKEVQKFQKLVNENFERFVLNPEIGKYSSKLDLYSLIISKQTTLYYHFNLRRKIIDLYVFWNNSKNPTDLIKLL
jgi:plasmid stabilization system protein ParE